MVGDLPAVLTDGLLAILIAGLPATVAAGRAAAGARLLRETTLGVTGLLGGSGAVERAGAAVELAGAG